MLLIEMTERDTQRVVQLYRRINRLLGLYQWRAVVGQFAGQVVMLVQADQNYAAMLEQIRQEVNHDTFFRVGISAVHRRAEEVGQAHQECREVLHIARRLKDDRPAVHFDSLGYLHALYRAGAGSLETNLYVPLVRHLIEAGETDLFYTLEAYLDGGANGVQTAEILHIHRSTLNYRLLRIKELCSDIDLSDPAARINLQIAIKLLRLFEVEY
jgi:DNA-binding PucR family transcriptional regulator